MGAGTEEVIARFVLVATAVVGGGSLLLFGYFLEGGPLPAMPLAQSESGRLALDGLLSVAFFVQHSGMIRSVVQSRLAARLPEWCRPAVYSVAAGAVLTLVVLLWQPSNTSLFEMEGYVRWLPRLVSAFAMAGIAWGISSLRRFDGFGIVAIRLHLRGKTPHPPDFVVRGPYRYVRHPLYFFMLVLFWATPWLALDRLLFNLLWTVWVVVGARLEEKDLVSLIGDRYREYQRRVPMIVPWRLPRESVA